jgi:Uncharacterized protein conserved in bacteria
MAEPVIAVEVVHAGTHRLWRCRVSLPVGSTAMQAVEATEWLAGLPAEVSESLRLGIHSRRVEVDHVLRDGDRVEIYRPLALDPMASRRRRAGKA